MIGRVKKWLGIEGVKLEIVVAPEHRRRTGQIEGRLRFQSLNAQTVTSIRIALVEKYTRGRGKEKLIDEYELGELNLKQTVEVPAEETVEIPFSLPFKLIKSEMDEFGDRNFLYGGLARAAKAIQLVRSDYRLEAEAKVKGVALNPFDKKFVKLK
ncbi:MAG: sporulation protein [Saprospiraceae bacterium]|nr:sporulation protein [Saprospiraceae bacterium]